MKNILLAGVMSVILLGCKLGEIEITGDEEIVAVIERLSVAHEALLFRVELGEAVTLELNNEINRLRARIAVLEDIH